MKKLQESLGHDIVYLPAYLGMLCSTVPSSYSWRYWAVVVPASLRCSLQARSLAGCSSADTRRLSPSSCQRPPLKPRQTSFLNRFAHGDRIARLNPFTDAHCPQPAPHEHLDDLFFPPHTRSHAVIDRFGNPSESTRVDIISNIPTGPPRLQSLRRAAPLHITSLVPSIYSCILLYFHCHLQLQPPSNPFFRTALQSLMAGCPSPR